MKRSISLILALALCFALAVPSLAVESLTSDLTPELAAAYLDIVEGLAREYGVPNADESCYYGMCGGYVADLGDGGSPEMIVGFSKESDYYPESYLRVYSWNGKSAVIAYEERVIASGNGRAWDTYLLCQNGSDTWLDKQWEYLPTYDYISEQLAPGGSELTHFHMENGAMKKFTPRTSASSSVQLGYYDYITFDNYYELNTLLKNAVNSTPAGISVSVGGRAVEWTDAEPFIDGNSRTMVPLRAVADAMSLEVSWSPDTREASFTDGSNTIIFLIDSTTARTGGGRLIQMDTSAVISNDRTYAPIRYLAEFFGFTVGWNASARTVSIK